MNQKPALTRKIFRLIAAYGRLPREGRAALDRTVGYLAALDKAAFSKTGVLGKPRPIKRRDI
ncbi:MAG: hypothetical protein LBN92_02945 [Treponema sp.]|nr:hypothetical protein [Treponema sp.]